jgi:hypothetical protein
MMTAGVAVLLGLGFLYVLWRPHWAVVLILVMFPLEQLMQAYIPALVTRSWLGNLVVALIAGFAVMVRVMRGEQIFRGYLNPVTLSILGLYALAWISLLYTPSFELALLLLQNGWEYFVLMLLLAPLLVRNMAHFRDLMTGVMFSGTIIAILIMLNPNTSYYGGRLGLDLGMSDHGKQLLGNPLAIAEMGGLMAIAAALIKPRPGAGHLLTLLRIVAFISGLGLAIGSGSRGQVLAAVVAGIACYPLARQVANPRNFILVTGGIGFLGLGVIGVFRLFVGEQNVERWNVLLMIQDIALRFDNAWLLLWTWLESPGAWFIGLGANAYSSLNVGDAYVHNLAIEVLCEEGLIGAGFLAMALLTLYRGGRDSFRRWRDDPVMRSVVATLISVCAFALLLSLKQGSMLGAAGTFMYWFILAKLARAEALDEAEAEPEYDSLYDLDQSYEYGAVTPAP